MSRNDGLPGLTAKQTWAIYAAVSGKSDAEVCKVAKVSRNTLWRWRKEGPFRDALIEARDQSLRGAVDLFQSMLPKAGQVLLAEMDSDDPEIRLQAAAIVVRAATTMATKVKAIDMGAPDSGDPQDRAINVTVAVPGWWGAPKVGEAQGRVLELVPSPEPDPDPPSDADG